MNLQAPAAAVQPDGVLRLPRTAVIVAEGADAASFLHGQLSNDVARLGAREARLAAYCSAKGRMLASLLVCRPGPETLWLVLEAALLPATLKRLSMFVLRAKAKLREGSGELAVLGLAGPSAARALADAGLAETAAADQPARAWASAAVDGDRARLLRLPSARSAPLAADCPRALWIGPAERAEAWLAAHPALAADTWDWLEVASGVVPVQAATVEAFVPQMLNYERVGGVDFRKGCYPGQEVVARSQYRGTLKRRGQRVDAEVSLAVGAEVYAADDPGQPAGVVAAAAPRPDGAGWSALVELKLTALDSPGLHLGAADGPALHLQPLPYPLPAEAE